MGGCGLPSVSPGTWNVAVERQLLDRDVEIQLKEALRGEFSRHPHQQRS
jgi:hypothetical protein